MLKMLNLYYSVVLLQASLFSTGSSHQTAFSFNGPKRAFNPHPSVYGGLDDIDIVTGSNFNGLTTFANLNYTNCFIAPTGEEERYDIAFLGAGFDTVGRLQSE